MRLELMRNSFALYLLVVFATLPNENNRLMLLYKNKQVCTAAL